MKTIPPGRLFRGNALVVAFALAALAAGATSAAGSLFNGLNEASQAVMAKARTDIEKHRKGNFVVRFLKPDGTPARGTAKIRHVGHDFGFGAPFSTSRAFLDLFNLGRINPHWRNLQRGGDGPGGAYRWENYDRMLRQSHEQGIAMRWHCLIYEQWGSPAWIDRKFSDEPWWNDIPATEEAWWVLIEKHLRTVATHPHPVTGRPIGELLEFDVINETGSRMWTNIHLEAAGKPPVFPSAHNRHQNGTANAVRMITLARKHMPQARLVVLEGWQLGDLDGGPAKRIHRHFSRLFDRDSEDPAIRAIASDDNILLGTQAHFSAIDRSALTMDRVNAGLDRFAGFGKKIAITEYDPPTVPRDRKELHQHRLTPEEQAAWSVNFHTLAFSKPYITSLSRWAFSDRQGQQLDAGLLFTDGRKKPEYHALRKLLQETWATRWEGDLSDDGEARFRGFFGTYKVEIKEHGSMTFALRPGEPTLLLVPMEQ